MKQYVYLDGKKIDDTLPLRSLFYGEGVFESFRYKNRLPVLFDEHINRMEKGANILRIPFPEKQNIKRVTEKALSESAIPDAYVKICLLSSGDGAFYTASESSQLLVIIKEYATSDTPVRLSVNTFKILSDSPLRSVKSMNYLENIMARREALSNNFDEALFLNERGEVVECSAGNIFWYKDQTLYTPGIECGCLPGTTRDLILDSTDESNIEYETGRYSLDNLMSADFIFISNSLIGCVPVAELQGRLFLADHDKFKIIKKMLYDKLEWI